MKKVYIIEKVNSTNGKILGMFLEYSIVGFFTSKVKADEFVSKGNPIEICNSSGISYSPKRIINEYKMTEINLLQ
jgi:hypothetical protein